MIDIYLLEQLVAVKNNKTLTKAANQLGISQPALSKSMKKLEDLLQIDLFRRTNRKIELNETGMFFAQKAEVYLAEGEDLLSQVQTFAKSLSNISVGTCAPIPIWELSPILSTSFPQMSITTELAINERLLNGLAHDNYQMVVLSFSPTEEEYFSAKFLSEEMFLSVPESHPFYNKESISPSELAGQFLIVYNEIGIWDNWIRSNFPDVNLMLIDNSSALPEAIGLGTALSFVSDYIIRLGRNDKTQKIIPITLENNTIDYYLVCKKKEYPKYRKAIQRLLDIAY